MKKTGCSQAGETSSCLGWAEIGNCGWKVIFGVWTAFCERSIGDEICFIYTGERECRPNEYVLTGSGIKVALPAILYLSHIGNKIYGRCTSDHR